MGRRGSEPERPCGSPRRPSGTRDPIRAGDRRRGPGAGDRGPRGQRSSGRGAGRALRGSKARPVSSATRPSSVGGDRPGAPRGEPCPAGRGGRKRWFSTGAGGRPCGHRRRRTALKEDGPGRVVGLLRAEGPTFILIHGDKRRSPGAEPGGRIPSGGPSAAGDKKRRSPESARAGPDRPRPRWPWSANGIQRRPGPSRGHVGIRSAPAPTCHRGGGHSCSSGRAGRHPPGDRALPGDLSQDPAEPVLAFAIQHVAIPRRCWTPACRSSPEIAMASLGDGGGERRALLSGWTCRGMGLSGERRARPAGK